MEASCPMDAGMMAGSMWAGMLISAVLGIALIVLVIVGIAWLVRQLGRDADRQRPGRTALTDLELRYARGEIDRDTYLAIRRDLEADGR